MTNEKCETLLDANRAKKTLFWTSDQDSAMAAMIDKKHYPYLQGYATTQTLWKEKWPKPFDDYIAPFRLLGATAENTADETFWNACSEAIAHSAEGVSYVMLPDFDTKGLDWGVYMNGHWATIEFPIICQEGKVTALYRLSAKDKTAKEDLTMLMQALRQAGTCEQVTSIGSN